MRTSFVTSFALAFVATVAVLPAPAAAAGDTITVVSGSAAVRISPDSFVIRLPARALQTPTGRAHLLSVLQDSARQLCDDVQPRADAPACERGVVTLAQLRTPPEVGRAIRLAQTEQQGTMLASVR